MIIDNPIVSGSLNVQNNVTASNGLITNDLTVLGTINATIEGTSATASYVEFSGVANAPTLLSGSEQIATEISGAFDSTSSSLASRISNQEDFSSSLDATFATDADLNLVSASVDSLNAATSSYALKTEISGSFTDVSSSIAQDIANISTDFADITNKPTLLSGSAQIASDISGSFTDLSSSLASELLKNTSDTLTGDLTVTGTVTAQEFHTEYISASVIYESGSTQFGDTLDDTHTFTGSINLTGSLNINGAEVGTGKLDETVFNSYTSSTDTRIDTLEASASSVAPLNDATSSYALKNQISGSFTDLSSSLEGRVSNNESSVSSLNSATSSYALQNQISGSFTDLSSSLEGRISDQESFSSSLDATFATDADLNLVSSSVDSLNAASSSYALKAEISGSTTELSSSIASDIEDILDGTDTVTSASYALTASYADSGAGFPFSGSAIITGSLLVSQSNVDFTSATGVSGSFSGSFVGDGSQLSGVTSYTDSDTLSYINSIGVVSGSAQVNSGSFSGSFEGDGSGLTGIEIAATNTVTASFTSTGSVTIVHSFNSKNVSVNVYDENDILIIPQQVTLLDNNNVKIDFGGNTTGFAVLAKGGHLVSGSVPVPQLSTVTDSFTSSTSHTVTHNFNTKDVIVSVYEGDDLIIPDSITTDDVDNVTVTFPEAVTGRVVVVKSGHIVSGSIPFDNLLSSPFEQSTSAVTASKHIVPSQDITYDLGSSDLRFRDIYLSSASIYLGNTTLTEDNLVTTASLQSALPAGTLSGSFQIHAEISGAFDDVSSSLASRVADQESFSSSLDNTFATDSDLNLVSSSVDSLNAASSSYALETLISGSFTSVSSSIASTLLKNTTDTLTGDLTVTGTITAQEFHTEFVSASIIYESGSTQFGNSADDTHVFTGRITQNDGNLGIGTVATTAHIHEASTGVANLKLTELGAGGSAQIYLENTVETFELGADASPQGFYIRALNDPNGYGQATFFLNASGSIGIGTTAPLSRIHIANTGGVDNIPLIGFSESGTNEFGFKGHFAGIGETGNSFEFYSFWSDNILRFLGNGNVGIGTNSPAKKLDVYGGDIQVHNTTPYLIFRNTTGGTHTIRRENDSLIIREGSPLTGDRMVIKSGGDVGIGTASPGSKLHVYGTTYTNTGNFKLDSGYEVSWGNGNTSILGNTSSNYLDFRVNNGVKMLLNTDGNLGIGTSSPAERLAVYGGAGMEVHTYRSYNSSANIYTKFRINSDAVNNGYGFAWRMGIEGDANGQDLVFAQQNRGSTDWNEKARLLDNGALTVENSNAVNWNTTITAGSRFGNTSGSSLVVRTTSLSTSFNSGLAIDGTHASQRSVINIKALGVYSGGYDSHLAFHTTDNTTLSEKMRITHAGYVGIGTDSPETNLEVHGIIQATNDPTLDYARLGTNTLGGYVQGYGGGVENFLIRSYASSGVQAYFNAGYIGLGTTAPGTALHVWQTAPIISMTDSNSFTDTNDRFQIRAGSNEGLIQWWDDSAGTTTTHMTFESNGNVGVGTTDAIRGFHVNSGVLIGDTYTQPAGSGWSDSNTQVIIGGSHNSGFNNDNPGVKLLITGHNNDSANIYPIYVEDENGLLDFYLKGRTSGVGTPTAVFGGSISFNGDTAAANQLDDYEEGTFSTTVIGVTASTNAVTGTYTKIGNIVTAHFLATISGKTGGTGNPYISLPFTADGTNIGTSNLGSYQGKNTIISGLAYMGLYGSNGQVYANDSSGNYIGQSSWSDGQLAFTVVYRAL